MVVEMIGNAQVAAGAAVSAKMRSSFVVRAHILSWRNLETILKTQGAMSNRNIIVMRGPQKVRMMGTLQCIEGHQGDQREEPELFCMFPARS